MFIHDIILLKTANRPDTNGAGRFNISFDRPMVMTCYPRVAGTFINSDGSTSDTLAGSLPFLNAVMTRRADAIKSEDIIAQENLINQFIKSGKFSSDQKQQILDAFIKAMLPNIETHLQEWTEGSFKSSTSDYSLGYSDAQIQNSLAKLLATSDRRKADFRSSDKLMLSGWFSQIKAAPKDDVFRLEIKPCDIITGVMEKGDAANEMQDIPDAREKPVIAIENISNIEINRKEFGEDGIKLSDMLAVVFSPMPETLTFSETDTMVTETLKGIEICEPGTYKKGTPLEFEITDEHIDSLIGTFNEMKDSIKPPLRKWRPSIKLGHNPTITPGNDGLPSFGWVENIYKVGSKAVADIVRVPAKLAKLVRAAAFRRVSPELKIALDKAEPRMMLTALSLLGADIPEIKTLDDICDLYNPDADAVSVACSETEPEWQYVSGVGLSADIEDPVRIMFADTIIQHMDMSDSEQTPNDFESAKGANEMNKEQLFALLKTKFSKDNSEVSAMEFSDENLARLEMMDAEILAENERLKKEIADFKASEQAKRVAEDMATIEQKCSELVTAKKLTPAMKNTAMTLAKAMATTEMTLEFSEDGKIVEHKGYDAFFEFMNKALPVHVAFSEGAEGGVTMDSAPAEGGTVVQSDYERGVADAKAFNEARAKHKPIV